MHGPRGRRPRLPILWDEDYTYDTRTPSPPSLEPLHITEYFPKPNPFVPSKAPSDLPSRVAALNRRAATVSAALEHLTTVVKPLESTKAENLSQTHLHDMHAEGVGLIEALHQFEEQTLEVLGVLGEMLKSRRDRVESVEWDVEEDWEGWESTRGGGKCRRRVRK